MSNITQNKDLDIGGASPLEVEEHGHIGVDGRPGKYIIGMPQSLKVFASLTSGYLYICKSKPGAASNASIWRVQRWNNSLQTMEFADGDDKYDNLLSNISNLPYQ